MSEFMSVAAASDPAVFDQRVEAGQPALEWNLPFPAHIDQEKIQINMTKLGRLHKVGAFTASQVTEHQGETSESNSISGINADGTAMLGKTTTVEAPRSESSLINDYPFNADGPVAQNFGKPIVVHNVNRPEIVQNVIDHKGHGVSDEKAWAKELDIAIRLSFNKAGKAHLVDRSGVLDKCFDNTYVGCSAVDVLGSIDTGSMPTLAMSYIGIYGTFLAIQAGALKKISGSMHLDQRRWSIFTSYQADRYVALAGLSKLPGLVTVR